MVLFLWINNHGYGFHRDELATLDDARHLTWGFVAYPPVTPFFGWLSLQLFGTSLAGFRFFASIASALVVVITGALAREFGGGKAAQILAAAATLGFGLATGSLMQYVAFDYLWWVLTFYFFVRLIGSDDQRWWIAIGASIGLGMLTKYSMLFCVAAIAVAFVFLRRWRDLGCRWLWLGVALSILLFLPNLLWQISNHFVSLDFLQHIHARDVRIGRTRDFLPDQLKITFCALPLALAGLWFFCFSKAGKKWRALACLYLVPLLLFVAAQGRGYYLAPTYPLLFAAGSAWPNIVLVRARPTWRGLTWTSAFAAMLINAAAVIYLILPTAPVGSAWFIKATSTNDDLREEFGWPELVEEVARIRDTLSTEERQGLAILTGNYGEAGAINLYGPALGLPNAIGFVNSFWARGYGDPPPRTLILVGFSREFAESHFQTTELVGKTSNKFNIANEETTDHPKIFICRDLKMPWAEFWKRTRRFG